MTPRAAMEDVIRRFEPLAQLPDDADQVREIYRGLLGGKRALIILDNARDAEQVAPLLPPAPAATIITARALIALPGGGGGHGADPTPRSIARRGGQAARRVVGAARGAGG